MRTKKWIGVAEATAAYNLHLSLFTTSALLGCWLLNRSLITDSLITD